MQPQLLCTSLVFAEHQMSRTGCPKMHTGQLLGLSERLQPSVTFCFAVVLGLESVRDFAGVKASLIR